MSFDGLLGPEEPIGESCMGRKYRCRVTCYQKPSTGAYVYAVEFRPLKTNSCPGCSVCGWLEEFIRECSGAFTVPDTPEDGAIYQLVVTSHSYDWSTGTYDPEEVGFVPDTA